jgi:type IV pilus modification protein PilV
MHGRVFGPAHVCFDVWPDPRSRLKLRAQESDQTPMRADPCRDSERGFTLIEVLVAITLLLVGVLGTATLIDGANARTSSTLSREAGTNLVRQMVEGIRAVPYAQLVSKTSLDAALETQAGLADHSTTDSEWTIERRGVEYTVTTSVCTVDDELDGYGVHPAGFCPDGAAAGTTDFNPDDYKRVSVRLAWTRQGKTEQVKQVTVIPNPGSAAGPTIGAFSMTAPLTCTIAMTSCPTITTTASEASFSVTTNSPAQSVAWSVDGEVQPADTVTGSGTAWAFDWELTPLPDGTYLIAAQAFGESSGPGLPAAGGPRRVLTIALNRNVPAAPAGFVAGRTPSPLDGHSIVDFEWLPHSDRDIEGYRVYRVVGAPGGGDDVLICPSTGTIPIKDTTCQDDSPPDVDSVDYYVVAVDREPTANTLREGSRSIIRTVTKTNLPPFAPLLVTVTDATGDSPVLSWQAVTPPDPNPGDTIEFYRIYRDGTAISDRYDRVAGTALSYTDFRADGQTHTYWVTAVDAQLGESTPVQAVSAP